MKDVTLKALRDYGILAAWWTAALIVCGGLFLITEPFRLNHLQVAVDASLESVHDARRVLPKEGGLFHAGSVTHGDLFVLNDQSQVMVVPINGGGVPATILLSTSEGGTGEFRALDGPSTQALRRMPPGLISFVIQKNGRYLGSLEGSEDAALPRRVQP